MNENLLRRRKSSSQTLDESVTELPWKGPNGDPAVDVTPIPTADSTHETSKEQITSEATFENNKKDEITTSTAADDTANNVISPDGKSSLRKAMSGSQVQKDESRVKKILVRVLSGAGLIGLFTACVGMGHLYVCLIVALGQLRVFFELVRVRYHVHFETIEDTIPLFRTTQWMWFCVAVFYTYGDFLVELIQSNQNLHYLIVYAQFSTSIAFMLYSGTFVLTIATMQVGHIKFQLNQLCWTIVVLCLTVGQMKYIMHNVINGLFWFVFPFLLVVCNDIMAYFCGMTCGRKFIRRPFISFSPNKTWEGFIGGGICTLVAAWYLSRILAQYTWMTCPANMFHLWPQPMECDLDPIFQKAQSIFPSQMFEIFPITIVKLIPGVVEICSNEDSTVLSPCISGHDGQTHSHFELVLKNVYPIQIHALWYGIFASVVAPFGGFLASAIKRAYGIKDFDSIIPGHGGVMDRLDCQFLMALCTWVHYNTFVKMATVSVPKLYYMYSLLPPIEQEQFLQQIATEFKRNGGNLKKLTDYAV